MSFYAQMPDALTTSCSTATIRPIKDVLENENKGIADQLKPVVSELKGLEARLAALHQTQNGKKPEEITQEEKDEVKTTERSIRRAAYQEERHHRFLRKGNNVIHQLIDLALLQNSTCWCCCARLIPQALCRHD